MLPYVVAGLVIGITCFVLIKMAGGAGGAGKVALDAAKFQKFRLVEKISVSQDTLIFRFALHTPQQTLGLPIGQHIALRALCSVKKEVEGPDGKKAIVEKREMVQHSYTPISSDDDKGYVDLMVKVYFANANPKFPFGGRLSQHLYHMAVGQEMEMMGPKGRFEYLGEGKFKNAGKADRTDALAMIAGGTGITPMLQIMRAIRKDPKDKTKVYLVYGNQTENDILLRKELDEVVKANPEQFHVWYTIDREPSKTWAYDVGFVTEDMLRKHLPAPNEGFTIDKKPVTEGSISSALALMCGPPPMLQFAIKPNLEKMGYTPASMVSF